MNNISESLLNSMSILFKDTLAKNKITKVIEALVVDLIDSSIGLYSINYENQTLKAYSNNIAVKYNKDDKVYVLSQDGTLDGTLIIIGAQSPYSGLYQDGNGEIKYIPVAESLVDLNGGNDIELCTYQSDMEKDINYIPYGGIDKFNAICNHYLEKYRTFGFQFNVRTNITDIYQKVDGDYGLVMNIPLIKDGKSYSKEVVFNIDMMIGDPYNFTTPTNQITYIQIEDGAEFDLHNNFSFKAFVKNFKRDETIITNDIFISDVGFFPVEVLSNETLSGQYLKLQATQGNFFAGDGFDDTKTIVPTLLINGEEVSLGDSYIRWYIEDAAITPTSAEVDRYGGTGWRQIKVSNTDHSLEISREDIKTSITYKAVIVYNDNSISQTIKIEDLDSKIKIKVETSSGVIIEGGGDVYLDVDVTYAPGYYKADTETLIYKFFRYDYQGNPLDSDFYTWEKKNVRTIKEGYENYHSQISFGSDIIFNGLNIINCSVYSLENGSMNLIGSENVAIVTVVNADYILSMQNSDFLFKYDADGDSPASEAYDGPLSSIIKGQIKPITFKVYKKDGVEFNESEYALCETTWELPLNSLMEFDIPTNSQTSLSADGKYQIVYGRGRFEIPYKIRSVYDVTRKDNTVRVTVKCDREGHIVKGTTNLTFMKDGDEGTNGTKYAAMIVYQGLMYGETNAHNIPHKFQLVWDNNTGKWYSKEPSTNKVSSNYFTSVPLGRTEGFYVKVFSDGAEILDSTIYSVLEWTMFDQQYIKPYFRVNGNNLEVDTNYGRWSDVTQSKACVLQAKIQITNTQDNSELVTYAYYPIEISYIENLTANMPVPTMEDGFNTVVYSSDGANPSYDSSKSFYCTNGLYNDDADDVYDYIWEWSDNLKPKYGQDQNSSVVSFYPTSKYNNGNSNNYVRASLVTSASRIAELQDIITDMGNQIDACELIISDKEDIENKLKAFSESYLINDWKNTLSRTTVIGTRERLLADCQNLLNYIEEYKNCFGESLVPSPQYDYMTIYTERKTWIDNALQIVANLLKTTNIADIPEANISDLDIELVPVTEAMIVEEYGQGTFDQVSRAVSAYNTDLLNYVEDYNRLVHSISVYGTPQEELDRLHLVYTQVNAYVNDSNLTDLVTLRPGEFTGFKSGLVALLSKLEMISSSAEYKDFLNQLEDLSSNYILGLYELNPAMEDQLSSDGDRIELYDLQARKADLEKLLTSLSAEHALIHIKPIIFSMNRYGYSFLNDWDGNKIYVDESGESYILSPLVGAGKKNRDNSFTGLLMGTVKEGNTEKTGLLGYSSGRRSILLDADTGRAEFGIAGSGQIIFDPSSKDKGVIYGGNFVRGDEQTGSGMMINLSEPSIEFGTGAFKVGPDGVAVIANSGQSGGWKIEPFELKSINEKIHLVSKDEDDNNKGKIYSNSHKNLSSTSPGFCLMEDGISIGKYFSYADDKLTLGYGNKKWEVTANNTDPENENSYIKYGNTQSLDDNRQGTIYIGTDGIRLGNKFKVVREGTLELGNLGSNRKWTVTSHVDSQNQEQAHISFNIDKFNFGEGEQIPSTGVYLGTDGIRLGKFFTVDQRGNLSAKSGKIADFKIVDDALFTVENNEPEDQDFDTLVNNGVYVGSHGIRLGKVEEIDGDPSYTFAVTRTGNLTAKKGTIGGWTITSNNIKGGVEGEGEITMKKDGEITGRSADGLKSWQLRRNGIIEGNGLRINGGSITIGSSFSVDETGQLVCKGARIEGIVEATEGAIGDFTIRNGALYTEYKYEIDTPGPGIHISSAGIAIGDTFKLDEYGDLTANSGTIGGISLDQNGLVVMDTTVTPPKVKFRINKNGSITTNYLTCNGGTIGGLEISSSGLSFGDMEILKSGTIRIGDTSLSNGTVRTSTLEVSTNFRFLNRACGYHEMRVVTDVVNGTPKYDTIHYMTMSAQ